MKNAASNFDTPSLPEFIYIGKLRYCYKLSVGDAEKILSEIGGVYNSQTHNIHRGEEYNRATTNDFLNSLTPTELRFDNRFSGPGSIVNEAHRLSHDGNYNPTTTNDAARGSTDPRNFVYWSIVDTCIVPLADAVLYVEEEFGLPLANELPELTHRAVKQILSAYSLQGAVLPSDRRQYTKRISAFGEESITGRQLRAYLYAAQGFSNKGIADKLKYSHANITKLINAGRQLAVTYKLPSLDNYLPPQRSPKRNPRKKRLSPVRYCTCTFSVPWQDRTATSQNIMI